MSFKGSSDLSCRLCLSTEKLQVSIFSEYGVENNIAKKISICLPVDISIVEKDEFSKTICNKCLCKLNMNYNFFLQTLKVSRHFKNNDKKESETLQSEILQPTTVPETEPETFDSINEFPKQQIVNHLSEMDKVTQMEHTPIDSFVIPIPPSLQIEETQLEKILETSSQQIEIGISSELLPFPAIFEPQQLEKDKFGQLIVWSQAKTGSEIPSSQSSSTKCKLEHKSCHRRKRHSKNCPKQKKLLIQPESDKDNFEMVVEVSPDMFSSSNSDFFGFEM